jgi:porphobilinogen synthase
MEKTPDFSRVVLNKDDRVLILAPHPDDETIATGGIIQKAVRTIKEKVDGVMVVTDVCLCEYTSHGHCGIVRDGKVVNDESLELLARQALSHAKAGADIVAPADLTAEDIVSACQQVFDQSEP